MTKIKLNPWLIVIVLIIVIVVLFLTRGDDGAKDIIKLHEQEKKELSNQIDSLKDMNTDLQQRYEDLASSSKKVQDSILEIQSTKENVKVYYAKKRETVRTYDAIQLERFFAERYPTRPSSDSTIVESPTDRH